MSFDPLQTSHHGGAGYLTSLMLIATPSMGDPRFVKSVIYLCAHTPSVAMGLVVNKPCHSVTAHDLFERHQIDCPKRYGDLPIMMGGPVDTSQGFVLHSADYNEQGSLRVDDNVALT
ncbi:MAG: YqgE/AlgH family protein, partial [Pseudomonadota bacterium]